MATDDELRAKLIEAAARDMYQRDDLFDSEHKFWRDTVTPTIDALMPAVRKAINQARAEAIDCLALELDYPADAQIAAKRADYWREEQ